MDFLPLLSALNTGIPSEAIGSLSAHSILSLIAKIKSYFKKGKITEEDIKKKITNDPDFANDISELQKLLGDNSIIMIGKNNTKIDVNLGTINFK